MAGKQAFALSVAILCLISVWVTSLEAVAVYAPTYAVFLTWASFFTAGGGKAGLKTSLICNLVGVIWGFAALTALLPALSFAGQFALPLAIFVVGGGLVLQSHIALFSFVPGCFFGCATFFAVANSGLIGPRGLTAAMVATVIGAIVGNLLGYVSEILAAALTKK